MKGYCEGPAVRSLLLPAQGPERTQTVRLTRIKCLVCNTLRLTAHLAPIIQLPAITSPFLRTARIASPISTYPILKQLVISRCFSGSVASPRYLKYSAVRLNLSAGYPKTTTKVCCGFGVVDDVRV